MSFLFAVLAILCGGAIALGLVEEPDKFRLLAGLGIIFAAFAAVAPGAWSWPKQP